MTIADALDRVVAALETAARLASRMADGVEVGAKSGGDPVTNVDRAINALLHAELSSPGVGWLSEESADDPLRLEAERVWVVDPLDGTREFIAGIPEWTVSIALVERGAPVVGGVCNPATGEYMVGSVESGVTYCGGPARLSQSTALRDARILASRSEVERGDWSWLADASLDFVACGSVAYKLALVAAGRADATWTLVPKSEWDVAAGVALVRAAGGTVWVPGGGSLRFNQAKPRLPGLAAAPAGLKEEIDVLLTRRLSELRNQGRRF